MACADTLSRHPEKFKVTIIEREDKCGGQATSISIDQKKYGAQYLNDGVQGGSPNFYHTLKFFDHLGYHSSKVDLQISFGKKDTFWTNVFPTETTQRFAKDIKRFGRMLKIVKWFELLFVIPVWLSLWLFRMSSEFGNVMVYPLMALFLGTGNQTAYVPTVMLERMFLDPNFKMWDYSPTRLVNNLPEMVAFPNLNDVYKKWEKVLIERGVEVYTCSSVSRIKRADNKVIIDTEGLLETKGMGFDEIVFAIPADKAKELLADGARTIEKIVLGNSKFYNDITITHCDQEYIKKYYERDYKDYLEGTCNEYDSIPQNDFKPMYFTHSCPQDRSKVEMTFNCTRYQPQFRDKDICEIVYQTIFLDMRRETLWTKEEINKDKVILEKPWHQLGHGWGHYVKVVPWMGMLNGRKHTWFAGSWMIVNMHEAAIVSGIAAAYMMGANYPFMADNTSPFIDGLDNTYNPNRRFGLDFFKKILFLCHYSRLRSAERSL